MLCQGVYQLLLLFVLQAVQAVRAHWANFFGVHAETGCTTHSSSSRISDARTVRRTTPKGWL